VHAEHGGADAESVVAEVGGVEPLAQERAESSRVVV
jgi:hypothetical protein